jgi:hypothetical protein
VGEKVVPKSLSVFRAERSIGGTHMQFKMAFGACDGPPLLMMTILMISGLASSKTLSLRQNCNVEGNGSVHDFNITALFGDRNISFADYRGKMLLLVNVATF